MSKKTHQKELERARAKRMAERQVQKSRRNRVVGVLLVVLAAAGVIVFAMMMRESPDVAIGDPDSLSEEPTADPSVQPVAGACENPSEGAPEVAATSYDAPPEMQIDTAADYTATIETTCGTIEVDLFEADAPITVNNFVFLARDGYYDGVPFHRVMEGFMIQSGDPTGTGHGNGGEFPGYTFEDELDTVEKYGYPRGVLAMANAGPNTNGSQFFIVQGDASHLTTHTVFGEVTEGMDIVDKIVLGPAEGDLAIEPVRIISVTIEGP